MRRLAVALATFLGLHSSLLGAQGTCTVGSRTGGNCTIGGTATHAITITISRAVRLELSASSIPLAAATGADFDAGFGQTAGPTLTVKSNAPWALSVRATQATWTEAGPTARVGKPSTDFLAGSSPLGPFMALTTSPVTLASGAVGTSGTVLPLTFRVAYAWLLDTPGSYSIPIQLTITSP